MVPDKILETSKPIILVIDDEPAILTAMTNILQDDGNVVETTSDPEQVSDLIGALVPDLIFLDVFIPHANGIDLLASIKKEYPDQKIIIMSGYGNISLAVEALKKGALDFIEKPFSIDDILTKITTHCSPSQSQESAEKKQPSVLVGESYLFKELIQYIDHIVPLETHLVVYGPRGIGKTLLAQYMHTQKIERLKLPNASFIEISALQNPMLDIDFKIFEQHGSLVIKYVDLLTQKAQKILLAALESPKTNIRVFCLTHKNLFALTAASLFNEDLFYALNATPIEIPSLNKRRFDIPLLVHHFLSVINKEKNRAYSCTTDAIRLLRNQTWQQHCNELQQLLKAVTAVMPQSKELITPEDIQPFLHEADHHLIEEQRFRTFGSLDEATTSFQKKFLLYQLKKNRYDLDQISNILNIDIIQLRSQLERLNISFGL